MKPFLLDVNVLVALLWPTHAHHAIAKHWFESYSQAGLRTCPMTQAGCVRIISNPRFSRDYYPVSGAAGLVMEFTKLPEHEFWPDDLSFMQAFSLVGEIFGHQQVTDAYLLGLAMARGGLLATFDRGLLALSGGREFVELIS